jgi:hypothetical protein
MPLSKVFRREDRSQKDELGLRLHVVSRSGRLQAIMTSRHFT